MELAFEPDARGVRPAKELVGNEAVVHAEPVRELPLRASHGGQRRDADTHAHEPVEVPGQVARAHDLRRITLRGIRRPDVEVVAHLRREEPARERREEFLQLDILSPLNGLLVAEGIDVGRVQVPLVQITAVAEKPEIDLALIAGEQQESDVGNVRERLGFRCLRFNSGSGAELGAAAVRHPDAPLVVAPGPSQQTRCGAHRSQQHDARGCVRRTLRAFTRLRCARYDHRSDLRRCGVRTCRRVALGVLCGRRRREKDKKKKKEGRGQHRSVRTGFVRTAGGILHVRLTSARSPANGMWPKSRDVVGSADTLNARASPLLVENRGDYPRPGRAAVLQTGTVPER